MSRHSPYSKEKLGEVEKEVTRKKSSHSSYKNRMNDGDDEDFIGDCCSLISI